MATPQESSSIDRSSDPQLGPNDIARRAFSPSADGYHKDEVRSFLQRIAGQMRTAAAMGLHVPVVHTPTEPAPTTAAATPPAPTGAAATPPATAQTLERIAAIEAQLTAIDDRLDQILAGLSALSEAAASPAEPAAATPAPVDHTPRPSISVERPVSTAATAPRLPRIGSGSVATTRMDLGSDDESLITESANDLLDGVLDDVMGRLAPPHSS